MKANKKLTYGSLIYLNFDEETTHDSKVKGQPDITKDQVYYAMSEGFQNVDINLEKQKNFQFSNSYLQGLFIVLPSFYNGDFLDGLFYKKENMKSILSVAKKRKAKYNLPKLIKGIEEEKITNQEAYRK